MKKISHLGTSKSLYSTVRHLRVLYKNIKFGKVRRANDTKVRLTVNIIKNFIRPKMNTTVADAITTDVISKRAFALEEVLKKSTVDVKISIVGELRDTYAHLDDGEEIIKIPLSLSPNTDAKIYIDKMLFAVANGVI